ncbi:MAG: class I SAM-dependent methyltransferase [Candidatus Woesearchaeota archaeon]
MKCDLCGHDSSQLYCVKDKKKVLKCMFCGLVFVNKIPSKKQLSLSYNLNLISPFHYYKDNEAEDYDSFKKRVKTLKKYVGCGSLLDVGCATGTFMAAARDVGFTVFGIDINRQSIGYARRKKLNAFCGELEKFPRSKFDVVVMNDFIEHTPSPNKTMALVQSLVRKGGMLYIVTPNISSVMARVFRSRWLHLKPDEHLYYFDPATIGSLLRRCGFTVLNIQSRGRIRNARILAWKLESYSKIMSRIVGFIPGSFLQGIRFNLNLGEEMEVIARKN